MPCGWRSRRSLYAYRPRERTLRALSGGFDRDVLEIKPRHADDKDPAGELGFAEEIVENFLRHETAGGKDDGRNDRDNLFGLAEPGEELPKPYGSARDNGGQLTVVASQSTGDHEYFFRQGVLESEPAGEVVENAAAE